MNRLKWIGAVLVIVALVSPVATLAEEEKMSDDEEKARELGLQAEKALKIVLDNVEQADKLYQESVGWAYFDMKMLGQVAEMENRGSGLGVLMTAGARTGTPMHAQQAVTYNQKYEFVIFFQTKAAWEDFVDGWEAGDTPKAAARAAGLEAKGGYVNGFKVYELVENGGVVEKANPSTAKFRAGFHN